MLDGRKREDISIGLSVGVVLKKDQKSGKITNGIVKRILTKSMNHHHGIKVELSDGKVGRVKEIYN
ncbi:MAG: YwbE family protein [Nanoarchaeota archaeon]|nr:YwbE family protein [Nanoarchaeota archaeon]